MSESMKKKTILLIEDEPEVSLMLKDFFNSQDFEVALVDDGAAGLEYLKSANPDLVITDLLLPGEHGIDLIKTIKEEYFIPVIVISGIYKLAEVQRSIQCDGVEGFFEKPLDLKGLLKRVQEILGTGNRGE